MKFNLNLNYNFCTFSFQLYFNCFIYFSVYKKIRLINHFHEVVFLDLHWLYTYKYEKPDREDLNFLHFSKCPREKCIETSVVQCDNIQEKCASGCNSSIIIAKNQGCSSWASSRFL